MKRVLYLVAAVLVATCGFAQKKNVSKAKNLALSEDNPDYAAARAAINEALANDETKDQPSTWFVAGLIGYQENSGLRNAMMIGQQIDEKHKGEVLSESFDYWMKALEMAEKPISFDKKGNPKFDKTTPRDVSKKLHEYYIQSDFFSYGRYLYEAQDYQRAYKAFMRHLSIPDLAVMQDAKMQADMPKDTIYEQIKFYAGICAEQAEMYSEAAAVFNDLKTGVFDPVACTVHLYQNYVQMKDTAAYVSVLQDAIARFPDQIVFLQYLINHYIYSGQMDQAVSYLRKAINREPNNAQYRLIMGNMEANDEHFDAAMEEYKAALALDPNMADAHAGMGRVLCNRARYINDHAEDVHGDDYQKILAEMDKLYKEAVPYFEKAHELAPTERDYMRVLSMLYDRFEMTDKYQAMQAEMNAL